MVFTRSPQMSCGLSAPGCAENGSMLIPPPILNCGASCGLVESEVTTIGPSVLTTSPQSMPSGWSGAADCTFICGFVESVLSTIGTMVFTKSPQMSCGLSAPGCAENGSMLIPPPILNCGASCGFV